MCEYCENGENLADDCQTRAIIESDGDNWGISVEIIRNEVDDEGYDYDVSEDAWIPIEFCPKCGRKL